MTSNKKIAFNSIIYIALGFLAPAINFILLPLYTRYLDTEDYAFITQSNLIQSIFANILGFGVNAAFSRFFYDYIKPDELQKLYSTALLSCLLTGLATIGVFSIIGEWSLGVLFKNDVFTYWEYGIFSIMTALFYNLQTVTLSYFRNQERVYSFAAMSIFFFLSVAFSIYAGVVFFEMKAKGSIIGRFVGSSTPIILYLIWYFLRNKISYSSIMNRQMILYGLPIVPYLFLNALLSQIDKFAVERFLDLNLLGLYGFGFLIASVNDIFINSLISALSPQIYKNYSMETSAQVSRVALLMKAYISVGILFNVAITIFGAIGVHYLVNDKYNGVAPYLILLSMAYIPRVYFTNYSIPISYSKKTAILPFLNLFALVVSGVALIVLTPLYGLYGACVARILILLSQSIFAYFFIRSKGLFLPKIMNYSLENAASLLIFSYITAWFAIHRLGGYEYNYFSLIPLFLAVSIILIFSVWKSYSQSKSSHLQGPGSG
jgi:O-antigen/teichoic acid export membrane protein